ncbi:probable N-terminal acetyltransferase B complex catalytic subunit NAT3 [Saccharomycodes ludwigii]|uniref:Probable N-terminal acetyltransferase B complex catalytic subunit NAT3 n=1 Tax=Saccharomycodes ludwigii TaxID=36035 RepID=A0A376B542_9ASCO|nr:probable N-terminal acetyltransferase B complex catalytic subunit NAT3 [Saccharomycodes ludwigii]
MTSIQPFEATDLFDLQPVNLDPLTENFPLEFYFEYLILWPTLFFKSVENEYNKDKKTNTPVTSGYIMGKTEGKKSEWHSHITAVTVSKNYRRLSIASKYLCVPFAKISDFNSKAYFVDLFVKCNNALAIKMYENLGYSIYRRVVGYYGDGSNNSLKNIDDDNDAYDMRLALSSDPDGKSIRRNGKEVRCLPSDVRF